MILWNKASNISDVSDVSDIILHVWVGGISDIADVSDVLLHMYALLNTSRSGLLKITSAQIRPRNILMGTNIYQICHEHLKTQRACDINLIRLITDPYICGAEGDPRLPCLRRYYQVNANGGQGTLDLMTASKAPCLVFSRS